VLVTVVNLAALTLLVLGAAFLVALLAGPAFGAAAGLLAAGCALAVVGRALEVDGQ
jgi:hypothetical protein